jgi:1-acyl-sn-glycerol-3-phosphate acyltransferase
LVQAWFNWYCRFSLRKFFHRVHLYGEVPFDPSVSTLYVVNHSSFWDPIAVNFLIHSDRPQRAYCITDLAQVQKHPFFRQVGAFSVDRSSPRDGYRAIQHAANLLNASPCAVVIFPQGKIEPADIRPLKFERGIERIIAKSPGINIVLVSLAYQFWLDQRAELLMDFSAIADPSVESLQLRMGDRLEMLRQAGRAFRPGDRILLTGRRSISDW